MSNDVHNTLIWGSLLAVGIGTMIMSPIASKTSAYASLVAMSATNMGLSQSVKAVHKSFHPDERYDDARKNSSCMVYFINGMNMTSTWLYHHYDKSKNPAVAFSFMAVSLLAPTIVALRQ